jgi:glycosyltransferase involved in cell wall biosynthesis
VKAISLYSGKNQHAEQKLRMKLTFVITGLAPGGAETMLLKLLENIDRSRFQPTVISLTTEGQIGPRIKALGVPVEALGFNKRKFLVPLKFFDLVRHLKESQPDVVHCWMYHADLVGGLAARLAGLNSVAWCVRNGGLSRVETKAITFLLLRLNAFLSHWVPKRIVFCSEASKSLHIQVGYAGDSSLVIPNGFNLRRFIPNPDARTSLRKELSLPLDAQLVGVVGRYHKQKNHLGFVRAAKVIVAILPDVCFALAGGDVDAVNSELTEAIAACGLRNHVRLLGYRVDTPRLMAAFDVLVSASDFGEAFPNVLGEAMACGTPCVTTDVGDSAYLISDTGRAVAPGDMEGLANAVVELLQMPQERRLELGRRARLRITEFFAIDEITQRYEAFYYELTKK